MQTPSVSAPARERPPTARLRYLHSALSGQRHTKSQMRKPAIRRDAASRALHNVIRRIRAAVSCFCCCCSFSNTTYSKPRRDVPAHHWEDGEKKKKKKPAVETKLHPVSVRNPQTSSPPHPLYGILEAVFTQDFLSTLKWAHNAKWADQGNQVSASN